MTEIWKPVVGWEGWYEVSNLGRVRSVDRVVVRGNKEYHVSEKILKQTDRGNNYLTVRLTRGGKGSNQYVHRLVGLSFINPNWQHDFDHKDNNTQNNKLDNLRQATRQQNLFNQKSELKGVSLDKRRGKWKSYITVNYKQKWLGYFETQHEAALAYNSAATEYFGEFANLNEV